MPYAKDKGRNALRWLGEVVCYEYVRSLPNNTFINVTYGSSGIEARILGKVSNDKWSLKLVSKEASLSVEIGIAVVSLWRLSVCTMLRYGA